METKFSSIKLFAKIPPIAVAMFYEMCSEKKWDFTIIIDAHTWAKDSLNSVTTIIFKIGGKEFIGTDGFQTRKLISHTYIINHANDFSCTNAYEKKD